MQYLWQLDNWPELSYDLKVLLPDLSAARNSQGKIHALASNLELKDQAEFLFREALDTSAIEGEALNQEELRSSIAKQLGLPTAGLPSASQRYEGLIEVLIDAVAGYEKVLSQEKMWAWHRALFPMGVSGLKKILVGGWRIGDEPMNIVSGSMGKEKVHFTAPPAKIVPVEMSKYLEWWESSRHSLDGFLRAGISHLYFVTIHPFEDGNGRMARALTDLSLAQEEKSGMRLYSLSSQIHKERKDYYDVLDTVQRGGGDITGWLSWFLGIYSRSVESSMGLIEGALMSQRFYQKISQTSLNERQLKVLKKMTGKLPDEFYGGMTTKKYISITKASPATVKRDLKELADNKIIIPGDKGGRSTSYQLNRNLC